MISKVYSLAINWLESDLIEVEVDINKWLPSFTIVWLPDTSLQESRERIRSALKQINFKLPQEKITVNLAPADIRKTGSVFDLPISIWILNHNLVIKDSDYFKNTIFLWELSLDWSLRQISWVLPRVIWAKEKWFENIVIPFDNYFEASFVKWINILPCKNLQEVIDFLNEKIQIDKPEFDNNEIKDIDSKYDFKYIIWQNQAKRALEIARAWLHNIIMSWPPWSWKTMLAKTFQTILPDLDEDEQIEISKIYSVSWLLSKNNPIIKKRPFRIVHHTASSVSIIWWWRNAKPWEISLAHKWVLFLDEVLEFPKNVLEVLRQPLEDWTITVNRVNSTYTYPAKFVLVWAMNPCPCWYLTDPDKECTCSVDQIKRYRQKLSWPMIDRIDIFIEVPKVKVEEFSTKIDYSKQESSSDIKKRIKKARSIQLERFKNLKIKSNSEMSPSEITTFCKLDEAWEQMLKKAVQSMNLSARAYYRILKLARSIADLEWSDNIEINHLREALSYRKVDDE